MKDIVKTSETKKTASPSEQWNNMFSMLWPVHLSPLGISMFACIFPFVGMFILMMGDGPSNPMITRGVYLICLVLWVSGLWGMQRSALRLNYMDWMMFSFFLLGAIGYFRGGFPGIIFEYFLALNVVPYIAARFMPQKHQQLALLYILVFTCLVMLIFLLGIPELYHQWGLLGNKTAHPVLFGYISTAAGLDIVMGFLPVLAASYLIIQKKIKNALLENLALILLSLGIIMSALIASRAVLAAIVTTVLVVVLIMPHGASAGSRLKIIVVMIVSALLVPAIMPENNQAFYKNWKMENSISVLENDSRSSLASKEDESKVDISAVDVIDYGDIDLTDSAAVRIFLWKDALGKIVDDPFIGSGGRVWVYSYPHPHNIILEAGVMFGLPALIIFVVFVLYILWFLFISGAARIPNRRLISSAVGMLFVYLLFYNLVQGQLASFRTLPLFLVFGLASAVVTENIRCRDVSEFNKHCTNSL